MMNKRNKLLQRLRNNPKNVSFDQLRSLLEAYGIILDRVRGSHHIFVVQIGDTEVNLPIPFHRPLKSTYIKKALALIDQVLAEQELEEDTDDESD
jgi:hypothetical protein